MTRQAEEKGRAARQLPQPHVFSDTMTSDHSTTLQAAQDAGLLASMIEQAPSLMAMVREPSHRIVLANEAFRNLFGVDLVGCRVQDVLPPQLAVHAIAKLDGVFASALPLNLEAASFPFLRPGATQPETRALDLRLQPITDDHGASVGIFIEGSDVTERVLAEKRIQSSLAIQTVGIIYWGPKFGLTQVNDAFLRMTGFTREEAIGLTWQDLTPVEFWPESEQAVHQVNTIGEAVPYEKQYYRKDGSRWWGLFAPRRVSPDEVVEFVLDVTERREAEAKLRRLNETLESRVLEEVTARLRTEEALRQSQKLEAIGQLTGGVAHDFNNLLTVIRGSAEMLRRADLPEGRRARYVEAINDTAERATKLTGQLLAFSRRQALRPEVFSVDARVEAVTEMLAAVVGGRIEVQAHTDCGICYVEADPTQFDTALVNMAVNARDAMSGAGRLTLRVEAAASVPQVRGHGAAEGEFVAISVHDTGSGIPPEQLAQIFEPFFTTKEVGKGTGLGLSQVYGFVKQSGGEVSVESEIGVGTTFTLYLPRVAVQEPEEAPQTAAGEQKGRGHILVVEDNEEVGAFSTQLLAELGFETTWAANADAALKLISQQSELFSAVFSDVVMPGMNGVDLAREIGRREPDLPVVLTSGYSHVLAEEGTHGFELLNKPYSIDDLTRVLRRAIAKRHEIRE
jgi:PAS domain S-box-containing protein